MRYKYIDQFTPPEQITSVTINNITTSTIYDNSDFDSLVDSMGIGKIFIPTEKPECEDGYYAKASYIDGDVITMVWEVVDVTQEINEDYEQLKKTVEEVKENSLISLLAITEIYETIM
jgi:hypothetical protein